MNIPIFPPEASTTSLRVDHIYFVLLGMSAVVLSVVFFPMAFFLFRYKRGKRADRRQLNLPTTKIETTWTSITTIVFVGFFAWGAEAYYYLEVPPPTALQINVIGKQWMWKIQHQEGNREINALHIPVDRPIELTLASEDVIHDFFIPAFRVKQDVVPGRFLTEWFEATRTGVYPFHCAEYCGAGHARMRGLVYVMTPQAYAAWLARGRPKDTLAQSGEILFRELGCSGCHVNSDSVHAPSLAGLYGKMVPLSDGTFVKADEKYIRDSIMLPDSQIVAGYKPIMPTFQGHVTQGQLLELIAYIKSIGKEAPAQR